MRATLTICLLSLSCVSAQAGRPLSTEDAGVLDRGDCEWETVAGRERSAGSPRLDAWATQVGCGIGLGSQLAASYGQARAGGNTEDNVFVGGKTGLADGGEGDWSLALAYGVALLKHVPVDIGFRFDSAFVNLAFSAPLAQGWTGHANLGAAYHREERVTHASWALAVEQDVGDAFGWGFEAYGEQADRPWVGAGARWDASDVLNLNASLATQRGQPRTNLFTLGLKYAF